MAAFSNYIENKLIDHIFRAASYTMPSTIYVALLTTNAVAGDTGTTISGGTGTGVEVSGSGYSRVAYNPSSSSNWTATQGGTSGASSGTTGMTSNSTTITFASATGSWGTVVGVAVVDAATNGNILFFGPLSVSKTVSTNDSFEFLTSELVITLA